MEVLGITLVGSGVLMFVMYQQKWMRDNLWEKWRFIPQVMCVVSLLGMFSLQAESNVLQDGSVEKNNAGEGVAEQELIVTIPGVVKNYPYTLMIPERRLSEKEKRQYMKQAQEEIESMILGENDSFENITSDLVLPKTLQSGVVSVSYGFDDYEWINQDGTLNREQLTAEGKVVQLTIEYSCQEQKQSEVVSLHIKRKDLTGAQALIQEISDEIVQNMEEQESDRWIHLPSNVGNYSVLWEEKAQTPATSFLILGGVAIAAILAGRKMQANRQAEERSRRLQLAYPEMVSQMMLLLGAGMSVRGVWERMARTYEQQRTKNERQVPIYEEMLITYREIKDGVSEIHAYERFADRVALQSYRRMIGLLIQNIKKGSKGLSKMLEREVTEAFEERKNTAKKLGEEAGTKLLMPMMLMLGIVLVIILVPVMLSLNV